MIARRLARFVAVTAGAAILAGGAGTAAQAAAPAAPTPSTGPASLEIRRIDASTPTVKVDVALTGGAPAANSFTVKDNGTPVAGVKVVPIAQASLPTATVLTVDTSSSMNVGAGMDRVRAALRALIAAKAPNQQMAVVAYGSAPRIVSPLTSDPAVLTNAVDRLGIGGSSSLWAGVRMAASLLSGAPGVLPQLLIVGDSSNVGSLATASDADGDLLASRALTYVVGLHFAGAQTDLSDLRALATAGQGRYFDAPDAAGLTTAFSGVHQDFANQYELSFASPAKSASTVIVSTGHLAATGQVFPGGIALGTAVNPTIVSHHQVPGPLRGKLGLLVIAVLVLAAVGLLAYAVSMLIAREDSGLTSALRPYQERGHEAAVGEEEDGDTSFVQSALMQRAVQTTARLAEERGVLDKVETRLEQADLALRPAEAILFYVIGVALLTILAAFTLGPILGIIILILAGIAPPALLNYLAGARLKKFNTQLPDTLQLLASSLRAGFSFLQGVEAVSAEVKDPMGAELRRVLVEARLGRPVEEALEDCAGRMQSPDFDWAVMAVNIQREVGGNLADLLQTVSVTMIERERLRRDVKSLTAEGRMSAIVLGIMPPALGLVFYVTNPNYIKVLFTHIGGQIALGVATVAMLAGFAWMKKIVDIKV